MKKFHQNGGKSNADINSSTFDKSLLAPKPRKPQTNNFGIFSWSKDLLIPIKSEWNNHIK